MIDFHTHILPGIDDGAKDVSVSAAMLEMEKEQGVNEIVLTPHYYAAAPPRTKNCLPLRQGSFFSRSAPKFIFPIRCPSTRSAESLP